MNGNLNIGTINGMTVEQILDMMVDKKIGTADSGGTYVPGGGTDYTGIIDGVIALGGTVQMADIAWTVVHIDAGGGCFYMCKTYVEEKTQFGSSTGYYGSTIASKCQAFYNSLPSNVQEKLMTVGIFGVQQKVFVPKVSQISGTIDNQSTSNEGPGVFDYFINNSSRVAYNQSGSPQTWWTSSPATSSYLWITTMSGDLDRYGPATTCGFRPFVALPL